MFMGFYLSKTLIFVFGSGFQVTLEIDDHGLFTNKHYCPNMKLCLAKWRALHVPKSFLVRRKYANFLVD